MNWFRTRRFSWFFYSEPGRHHRVVIREHTGEPSGIRSSMRSNQHIVYRSPSTMQPWLQGFCSTGSGKILNGTGARTRTLLGGNPYLAQTLCQSGTAVFSAGWENTPGFHYYRLNTARVEKHRLFWALITSGEKIWCLFNYKQIESMMRR